MAGKRSIRRATTPAKTKKDQEFLGKDVEDRRSRPKEDRQCRFRDNNQLDRDDQRRVEFKQKLMDGVERSRWLEEYRKSGDDVVPFYFLNNAPLISVAAQANPQQEGPIILQRAERETGRLARSERSCASPF